MKQAGSLVSPDRLRFDFSHYAAVSETELRQIERLANEQVLLNDEVAAWETSKDEALAAGAIAFFGDKYGDVVRVLRAGSSVELCGGTHVSATGDIGTIKIIGESSIGSNLRRIEATTGMNTVEVLQRHDALLTDIAGLVGGTAEVAVEAVGRKLDELKAAQDEIKQLRAKLAQGRAGDIAQNAVDGVVVERVDGMAPNDLRDLCVAVRQSGARVAVLGGVSPGGGVSLVCAIAKDVDSQASDVLRDAAKSVGGGGGGKGDVATAGGKNADGLDAALVIAKDKARAALGLA